MPPDWCDLCSQIVQSRVVCIGWCDGIKDDTDLQERVDAYAESLDDLAWAQVALHGGAMRHRGRWRPVETPDLSEGIL